MKRICKKCGVEKDIELFVKVRDCKYGFCHVCKICNSKWKKSHYNKNKEKIREKVRLVRKSNKGKKAKACADKKYASKNKEKITEYWNKNKKITSDRQMLYRKNNREKLLRRERLYRKNNKEKIAKRNEYESLFLSDNYIRGQICKRTNSKTEHITQEMITLKRELIQYKRLEKELNHVINCR